MDNKQFEQFIGMIDAPDILLPTHKKQLKHMLLKHSVYKHTNERGGGKNMRHVVRYCVIGILAIAILVGVSLFNTKSNPLPTQKVAAQEVVEKAMDTIITLSDDERKVLEEKIKSDLASSLIEARNAKDLTVVPEDQITRVDPPKSVRKEIVGFHKKVKGHEEGGEMEPGTRVEFPGNIHAPHGVTVLRYTNPDGQKVILGIDEDDKPVMKMIMLTEEAASKMKGAKGGVMFFKHESE